MKVIYLRKVPEGFRFVTSRAVEFTSDDLAWFRKPLGA
jgi:hypothetical protein